ncbi:hypothetical protein B0O99DRAFT_604749 [Bisporella sp. PMI_857]|nr:hypothetical protein B0O99DRAFT_604749 [Bisporella sp. PMI_857]
MTQRFEAARHRFKRLWKSYKHECLILSYNGTFTATILAIGKEYVVNLGMLRICKICGHFAEWAVMARITVLYCAVLYSIVSILDWPFVVQGDPQRSSLAILFTMVDNSQESTSLKILKIVMLSITDAATSNLLTSHLKVIKKANNVV